MSPKQRFDLVLMLLPNMILNLTSAHVRTLNLGRFIAVCETSAG
jgi:hypothetical protein